MVARFRLRRPCRPRPKRRGAAIAATAKFIQRVLPAILLLVGDVLEAIERTLAHLAANTRATSPADLGRIELSGSSPGDRVPTSYWYEAGRGSPRDLERD